MSVMKMLGDVLHDFHGEKKSGALFVAVREKSENLVRIFLHDGNIRHVSYGTCSGRDCLAILECYEFTTAYFVKDMKAPAVSADLPSTTEIIEQFRRANQSIMMQ